MEVEHQNACMPAHTRVCNERSKHVCISAMLQAVTGSYAKYVMPVHMPHQTMVASVAVIW